MRKAQCTMHNEAGYFILLQLFGKLKQSAKFIAYLYKLHGPNFSEGLRARAASELDGSVLGFPLPFLPAGLVYSVALTISLLASSRCNQLPRLGKL